MAEVEKQEILKDIMMSLPSGLSKTQRKKQAKIRYKNMLMKKKSKGRKRTKCKRPVKTMACNDASKVRIAIDLGYEELMNDKDIKMLMKQCQRCYSENRHANHPLQLYLTSFTNKCKERMGDAIEGYHNWDVYFNEQRYIQVFDCKEIVFLVAESPNILTELSSDKVYVIGGLVDHNHHKGYCYREALAAGVNHAQLPLKEHVTLSSRSVLAVSHGYVNYDNNWKKAIDDVIPQRKLAPVSPDDHVTEEKTSPDSHVTEEKTNCESPDSHVTEEKTSPDDHVTEEKANCESPDSHVTEEKTSPDDHVTEDKTNCESPDSYVTKEETSPDDHVTEDKTNCESPDGHVTDKC